MIATTLMPIAQVAHLDSFIARWTVGEGGQERANYQLFLSELCDALEVPRPDQASHDAALNAYAFERAVTFREPDGSTARGRIDLYKRGSFVLEAKQSRRPGTEKAAQSSLFDPESEETVPLGRRTASRAWNILTLPTSPAKGKTTRNFPTGRVFAFISKSSGKKRLANGCA